MHETAGEQTEQLPTQSIGRPKVSLAAHLFSAAIIAYVIGWVAEFVFITRVFGLNNSIALSFISVLPFIYSVYMRSRWKSLRAGDWRLLLLVSTVSTVATSGFVNRWYESGWHYRPGTWTFNTPPSQKDLTWNEFKKELRKDPTFKNITPYDSRGVYWLEGSLKSEADLDRMITLAKKCEINRERLDGPYQHSISITIPGTNRSRTYD